jgi:hypothetical protein
MMLAMALPMLGALLVSLINGEIQIADSNCPPHSWSTNALNGALECIECNKCNNFSSD